MKRNLLVALSVVIVISGWCEFVTISRDRWLSTFRTAYIGKKIKDLVRADNEIYKARDYQFNAYHLDRMGAWYSRQAVRKTLFGSQNRIILMRVEGDRVVEIKEDSAYLFFI